MDGVAYTAEHIVIATGAMPRPLDIPGAELVLTSEQFMAAEKIGPRVVFIGGGYISFEFAHMAAATGAQVTIVHRDAQVLEGFEPQLADMLAESYRAGAGSRCCSTRRSRGSRTRKGSSPWCWATGRASRATRSCTVPGGCRTSTRSSWTPAASASGDGGVEVDEHMRSRTNPRVWAAGDAAALGAPLTPVGIAQARVIVRRILGDADARFAPAAVASVVFSNPPLASVGLTEEQAAEQGIDVEVKFSDTSAWVSSRRMGMKVGGAKVLVERGTGRIVGAHLLGPHADEMINVFTAAIAGGMTAEQLRSTLWAYPTASSEIVYLV